jgi:hypothetical protein
MRSKRLQLVGPENSAKATTDTPTEVAGAPAMPDGVTRRLCLVETDEGTPPDDAA